MQRVFASKIIQAQLKEARGRAALADEILRGAAERERLTAEVHRQADISSAALNNIVQGVLMYDKHDRLVMCNRRFAEIYQLPEHLTKEGTENAAILEHCFSCGTLPPEFHQARQNAGDPHGSATSFEYTRSDGRIISIQRRPLPNGGRVTTHMDVTEIREAAKQIAYLAANDPLTDLPNRAAFAEARKAAGSRLRHGKGFAVHTIDLDRFKEVNDTLGHPVGDLILKEVAARLRRFVRREDIVTRMGGDEFAVLQSGEERPEQAEALAAGLVAALSEPYAIDGHTIAIGASIGISLAPEHAIDGDELLTFSDLALYQAKFDSRGTYHFFEPGMESRLRERRSLEIELSGALREAQFEVHYQPLLTLTSRTVGCFEALVRWRHPARGMIQPSAFIEAAEESGLIVPIGEWVLRQACRDAVSWPSDVSVSVNLSPAQFKRGDLLALVRTALANAGLDASRLELEITESVLLRDEEWVRSILERLTQMGVRIVMDDFGTGYSSLTYLRNFPFSKIKIDRSFIADVVLSADSLAIVQATIDLAHKLGMTTTAEGVETREQMEILAREGCTEVQGFHVSAAVPASQVPGLLRTYKGWPRLRSVG